MIATLIGAFVAILVGVSLVGPLSTEVVKVATTTNTTGGTCLAALAGSSTESGCQLYLSSSWGVTVLKMVPGFFALSILGIGVAATYSSLRQAGIV